MNFLNITQRGIYSYHYFSDNHYIRIHTFRSHCQSRCCTYFTRAFQVVVTYSSTYVLVALSIDRYDAITHPMNFSSSCKSRAYPRQRISRYNHRFCHVFTGRRARALIGCAWILSFVFAVPSIFINEETIIQGWYHIRVFHTHLNLMVI